MAVILACLPDETFSFSMDLDAIRMSEGIDDEKRRLSIPVMRSPPRDMRNPELANPHQKKTSPRRVTRFSCPGWDSNPHALTDTWPSTMPVYQFQHLGGARLDAPFVTRLGLEPRTLSLKVRCSNQLSYQVVRLR